MKKYLPIIFLVLFFLFLKFQNTAIKISDTNIYWYTAYAITQGQLLYKDIFFTNFPLFPYISAVYFFLVGKQLSLYYFTSAIEVCINSLLIFYIIYTQTKKYRYAFSSFIIYLFSFMVLSTSDHQTGVFAASLFGILCFYFFTKEKFIYAGAFLSLTFLTKAYFLPFIATIFLITLLSKNKKNFLNLLAGFLLLSVFVLTPSFLFAFSEFVNNVFTYSLSRSAGIEKSGILWFFITKDFFFFVILMFNIFYIKKNLLFGIFSILSILFFFTYKDTYYLYLNFMAPFLVLSLPNLLEYIETKTHIQKMVLPTIIIVSVMVNLGIYLSGFRNLQSIPDYQELTDTILQHNPDFLYGVNDTAPALAYSTQIPLMNNIVDTNANIFRKKFLDAKKLTKDATTRKTILVAHGTVYKEFNIEEYAVDEIFDLEQVKKSCTVIKSVPVFSEGYINRISLLKCY